MMQIYVDDDAGAITARTILDSEIVFKYREPVGRTYIYLFILMSSICDFVVMLYERARARKRVVFDCTACEYK